MEINEMKNVAEMSLEAAEEFAEDAIKAGKDVKKIVIGGIVVALLVGGTVIVIKKVKPISRLKAKLSEAKERRAERKAAKATNENSEGNE